LTDGNEIRAQIDTETVRGLQLINGGMAAGLVTLLPAILRDPNFHSLGNWMIAGALFGAAGLGSSIVHNRLRRKCSLEYSKTTGMRQHEHAWATLRRFQSVQGEPQVCTNSVITMWVSLLLFFLGATSVAIGFIKTRSAAIQPTSACWVLEHVNGHEVKFNTCTGKTEPLVAN
jgi:hypothetical protein